MWDNVLGHAKQKEFLQKYMVAEERPHALLFLGASGLGKGLLARAFAKSLLCPVHSEGDACDSCKLLNLLDGNFSHPDFLLVERQADAKSGRLKDISIEQVRNLITSSAYAPVMSATKVCIVEAIDTMSVAAANAFLKLLEEPPAGWVLILLAESEDKLLSTILSRVVCLRFQPVPEAEVATALQAQGMSAEQASVLASLSEGSMGTAVQLAQADVWETRQMALAFLEALPLSSPVNYLAGRVWQSKNFERGAALLFVKLLYLLIHDLLMCKAQVAGSLYNSDLQKHLEQIAASWSVAALKKALGYVQETYTALNKSVGVRMALEAMALKIDLGYKE